MRRLRRSRPPPPLTSVKHGCLFLHEVMWVCSSKRIGWKSVRFLIESTCPGQAMPVQVDRGCARPGVRRFDKSFLRLFVGVISFKYCKLCLGIIFRKHFIWAGAFDNYHKKNARHTVDAIACNQIYCRDADERLISSCGWA